MKTFIKRIILFGLFMALILSCCFCYRYKRCDNISFALPQDISTLFLGASHIELGIDDSHYPGGKNIASSSERYMFTYLKLKKLIEANDQIDTVFLQFAPTDIWENTDTKYFASYEMNYFILKYYTFFRCEEWCVYRKHKAEIAPIIMLNLFSKTPKSINSFGGYNPSNNIFSRDNRYQMPDWDMDSGHSINYKYLNKIIEFTDAKGIKLYFIYMPVLFPADYYDQEYFYNSYESNFSEIELLDYSAFDLPDSCRADEHHLNKYGAVIFTQHLRDAMSDL